MSVLSTSSYVTFGSTLLSSKQASYATCLPKAMSIALSFSVRCSATLTSSRSYLANGCGRGTRTLDLQLMRLTSSQLLHPAIFTLKLFKCKYVVGTAGLEPTTHICLAEARSLTMLVFQQRYVPMLSLTISITILIF